MPTRSTVVGICMNICAGAIATDGARHTGVPADSTVVFIGAQVEADAIAVSAASRAHAYSLASTDGSIAALGIRHRTRLANR